MIVTRMILCKNDGCNLIQTTLAAEGRLYKGTYARKNRIEFGNNVNELQLFVLS